MKLVPYAPIVGFFMYIWSRHGLTLLMSQESSADSCTTQDDRIGMQSSMYSDTQWAHKTLASSSVQTRTQVYSATPTRTLLAMWTTESQRPDNSSNLAMEQPHGSRNFSSTRPHQPPKPNTSPPWTQRKRLYGLVDWHVWFHKLIPIRRLYSTVIVKVLSPC